MTQHDSAPPGTLARTHSIDPMQAETAATSRANTDAALPEQLGEFRILGLLGRGGMGAVYLAEQQNPQREVALKVLRGAHDDPDALRRFQLEGEALAMLDHPNIAHVFATGIDTRHGATIPFLAMELVRGRHLLADADARGLDANARVRQMLAVCHGVQHAHQRGVIHRDLKPANILVDGEGRPKIMDFGIARIVSEGGDAATRLTEAGQVVGTIPYMSPEQLRGESRKIDVRTDVFALGVILYELLSGKRPRNLDATSLFSAIKSAERNPMVPLAKIEPKFGGDLDTIVMKALAESPSQRYASVADLAADLERYLDHRPIEARAPSALYIAGKFARRHRALVAAASIAFAALIAATAFSLYSAQKEREARELAERNAAIAQSVNDFMDSMFSAALPQEALGREISVREIVDQAARQLASDPPKDRDVDARITHSLAQVYQVLGRYDDAQAMLDAGLQRIASKGGAEPELSLELQMLDADLAGRKGDFSRYEAKARAAVDAAKRDFGTRHPLYFKALNELAAAVAQQSRSDEASAIYEEILAAPVALLDGKDDLHSEVLSDYGTVKRNAGDYKAAERIFNEALDRLMKEHGERHPSTLVAIQNIATLKQLLGDIDGAEAMYRRALEGRVAILGASHPETLTTRQNLANVMVIQGRQAEALPLLHELLALQRQIRGPGHPNSSIAAATLAWAYEDLGQLDKAEALYRETLALEREHDADFPETYSTQQNFAMLLMNRGKLVEAAENFAAVIARAAPKLGPQHPYIQIYRNNYGECLTKLGRYDEALKELRASHEGLVATFGPEHDRVKKSLARIAAAEKRGG